MITMPKTGFAAAACWAALGAGTLSAQSFRTVSTARMALGEDSLRVGVEFAAGTLRLAPGDGRVLYQGELYYDEEQFRPITRYRTRSRTLQIGLSTRRGGLKLSRIETPQRLDLTLTPYVPIRLTVELGAARAELELGGLSLAVADIKAGAAGARVGFSSPNRVTCRRLNLAAGAAEFRAEGLANARCEHISFVGGVGDVTLDFTGEWTADLAPEVDIKLGLGQLTLRLPRKVGVAIELDRFLASFDQRGFSKRGSRYVSTGYDTAAAKLHLSVKAVLGDIDIEWVDP